MILEILIGATLAVNVIGGGILVKWLVRHIGALEGTVKAQGETLATVGKLNDTLVNVFKALDPDRWAKEVEVHKRLADEKAKALVEEAQRKFEAEKDAVSQRETKAVTKLLLLYGEAIGTAVTLLAWVPKSQRLKAIEGTRLKEDSPLRPTLLMGAQEAPDLGPDLPSLFQSVSKMGV